VSIVELNSYNRISNQSGGVTSKPVKKL